MTEEDLNFDPSAKKKKKKKKTAFDPEAEGGEEEELNILQKNIKTRNCCFINFFSSIFAQNAFKRETPV